MQVNTARNLLKIENACLHVQNLSVSFFSFKAIYNISKNSHLFPLVSKQHNTKTPILYYYFTLPHKNGLFNRDVHFSPGKKTEFSTNAQKTIYRCSPPGGGTRCHT